jgi:hypothetical protein
MSLPNERHSSRRCDNLLSSPRSPLKFDADAEVNSQEMRRRPSTVSVGDPQDTANTEPTTLTIN